MVSQRFETSTDVEEVQQTTKSQFIIHKDKHQTIRHQATINGIQGSTVLGPLTQKVYRVLDMVSALTRLRVWVYRFYNCLLLGLLLICQIYTVKLSIFWKLSMVKKLLCAAFNFQQLHALLSRK